MATLSSTNRQLTLSYCCVLREIVTRYRDTNVPPANRKPYDMLARVFHDYVHNFVSLSAVNYLHSNYARLVMSFFQWVFQLPANCLYTKQIPGEIPGLRWELAEFVDHEFNFYYGAPKEEHPALPQQGDEEENIVEFVNLAEFAGDLRVTALIQLKTYLKMYIRDTCSAGDRREGLSTLINKQ